MNKRKFNNNKPKDWEINSLKENNNKKLSLSKRCTCKEKEKSSNNMPTKWEKNSKDKKEIESYNRKKGSNNKSLWNKNKKISNNNKEC